MVGTYTNCYNKWLYLGNYKKDGGKDPDRKNAEMKTAFIDTDAGQARWGGWNKSGRDFIKAKAKEIAEARQQPHVAEVEELALKRIREEQKIEERDQKRLARKRRRTIIEEEEESEDEFDQL